ncbi:tetratricopeptide repeat protein [Pseudomonas monsensis]|uniref:tetratricopeptide repeat protein n=1 Tax=Pseudomonas monsensis TaxID=2745509 RepID=UPI002ABA54E6|nr:sel1 repeat family protein [Pseudomonas monsensis]MDZ3826418.1 sel1 repeat family protein [Pseudomonas monsensis]
MKLHIAGFLLVAFTPAALALSDSELAMKSRGIILYNQFKAVSATPLLRIAAEAGDHEAQYYLAESLRQKNSYMNPEAKKWYEMAATQGDLYAMIQLGRVKNDLCKLSEDCPATEKKPSDWLNQASSIAQPKAEDGNAEAMYIMYEFTLDTTWLEKAAAKNHQISQYLLARSYHQGDGFFLPWKRSEVVENLFKASAEGGYPPSMMEYGALLYEKGDIEGFRHWNEQAALASYATTVYGYGSDLAHEPDTYGFPFDVVKGYALVYTLKELDGGGGLQERVESKLAKIEAKMTAEQIEAAKKFSQEWAASHPPLSFFPDKLSR